MKSNIIRFLAGMAFVTLYIVLTNWVLGRFKPEVAWIFFSILPFLIGFLSGKFSRRIPEYIGMAVGGLCIPILLLTRQMWIMIPIALLFPLFVLMMFVGSLTRDWLATKGILTRKPN